MTKDAEYPAFFMEFVRKKVRAAMISGRVCFTGTEPFNVFTHWL